MVLEFVVQQKGLKQLSCATGALQSPSGADMLCPHCTDAQTDEM